MKGLRFVCMLVSLGSACVICADEPKVYVRSPDTVRWRLTIDGPSYSLQTRTLEGVVCEETGSVVRSGEKMRFVVSPTAQCEYGEFIREKWFISISRRGNEFLVTEDQIPELEERLSHDQDRLFWFPYFERVSTKSEGQNREERQGEPGATDNPGGAQ